MREPPPAVRRAPDAASRSLPEASRVARAPHIPRGLVRTLAAWLVVGLAYAAAEHVGLALVIPAVGASPVWPPTGVGLAALLLLGRRVWPALFAAAALVGYVAHGTPPAAALAAAAQQVAELLLIAFLVQRFAGGTAALRSVGGLARFGGLSAAGTMLGALAGVASLFAEGAVPAAALPVAWLTWWVGDLVAILVLAPVLLLWAEGRGAPGRSPAHGARDSLIVAVASAALAAAVFGGFLPRAPADPVEFLVLPPIIWAALRFQRRDVATAILIFASGAVLAAAGPRATMPPTSIPSMVWMQAFIGVTAFTGLALAAAVEERRRSAEAQRAALSLLSATLDSTADGILVVGTDGRITSYNARFAAMWGIPQAVLEARNDAAAIASVLAQLKDPDAFLAKVRELYARPEAESFDTLEFRDGRVFERYSLPQRVDGTIVGRVWSFRDVTERRRAEEERLANLANTQELARLRELDRFKSSFINLAAHELGTPLTPMLVQLHLLQAAGADIPEPHRRSLDILARNAQRLDRLVREILDAARFQAEDLTLQRSDVDPVAVARACVDAFRGPATASGVELSLSAGTRGTVSGDAARLRQALANLVDNALKFTAAGGRVVVAVQAPDADRVELSVVDNGAGLDAADLAHIFQPFSQVHDRAQRAQGGAGLGLFIARRIAEAHGGKLVARSPGRGRGATFSLVLPRRAPARPAREAAPGVPPSAM